MIIIITGASHVGKTKLAQALLERIQYPYLSIDHLKMGLIRSGNTTISVENDVALTKYLWPIICEMIKTAIENNQNLIVEGCYVPFDWDDCFTEFYLSKIKYLCLCYSNDYIDQHYNEIKSHSSDIEKRLDDGYCTREQLKIDNAFYREGCMKFNLPCIVIKDQYEKEIDQIISQIEKGQR